MIVGPNQYLVQIKVTNNALTTANNVIANFTWTTTNPYINLAPDETETKKPWKHTTRCNGRRILSHRDYKNTSHIYHIKKL